MKRLNPIFLTALLLISMTLSSCSRSIDGTDDVTSIYSTKQIKSLKSEIQELKTQLTELPPKELRNMNGFLGYHSALVPECEEGKTLDSHIDFQLQKEADTPIETVVLMPAYNPNFGRDVAYGFPQKFRIEFSETKSSEPTKTINFTQKDFSEQSLTPLVIPNINATDMFMRIVVDRGVVKDGWEYFALGEVFIFTQGHTDVSVNIAPYAKIETSDSFESSPSWSPFCLNDLMTVYNMPLGPALKADSDLVAFLPIEEEEPQIEVIIDLGFPQATGRIEFFPAKPQWQISLPHFGYPRQIIIERFETDNFNQPALSRKEILNLWNETRSIVLGDIFFSVPLLGIDTRYVRLTFSKFPTHGDSRVFAMGEISILYSGRNISANQPVRILGLEQEDLHAERLVDNYAYKHEIIPPEDWLIGLEMRHQTEVMIERKSKELADIIDRNNRLVLITVFVILLLAAATAISMYIQTRISRTRDLNRIRRQISSDLHDDVGSSIGAFSLGMERLKNHPHSEAVEKLTQDLRLTAREAAVALREAVWLTNQNSILLQDLGKMIKERAYFLFGKDKVHFEIDETLPEIKVNLVHKRNILLLFKEALHNVLKHAEANQLTIKLYATDKEVFNLQIADNGCGINLDQTSTRKRWGISTMNARAAQMGGKLEITSGPNQGTSLKLTIPYHKLIGK